jgi:hypothetical protein
VSIKCEFLAKSFAFVGVGCGGVLLSKLTFDKKKNTSGFNMKKLSFTLSSIFLISITFIGCAQSSVSPQEIDNRNKLTAGTVQTSIRNGMPSSEIIEALGSPNMITQDEEGNEVWVYDKSIINC